jgi:uncharacterized phage protein gp47/JayE
MAWGLSKTGFVRPNQAQLKEEIDQRQKELFGDDVNLSAKSPNGILSGILSWVVSLLWQTLEKIYHNGHVSEAEGVSLDYKTIEFNTSRNPEQYAETSLTFTGTPNYTILAGTRFETEKGVDYALKEDLTLDGSGNGTGEVVSLSPGVIGNTFSSTITVQSEPNVDIFTVTNTIVATGGREEETDEELRNRLLNSGASNGSGTPNAILADVLAVTGVRAANITVNSTDAVVNGQPAHSNHVFALGGDGQTIADALFKNYVGLQFYGSSSFVVNDIGGNSHTISYTPAMAVNIFVDVTLTTDNTFQTDGAVQVKDAVVKLIGGTASDGTLYTGLNMGDDVIYSRILATIMSIQGVEDAVLKIGTAPSPSGTTNIAITPSTVAQASADNIEVTV